MNGNGFLKIAKICWYFECSETHFVFELYLHRVGSTLCLNGFPCFKGYQLALVLWGGMMTVIFVKPTLRI